MTPNAQGDNSDSAKSKKQSNPYQKEVSSWPFMKKRQAKTNDKIRIVFILYEISMEVTPSNHESDNSLDRLILKL